MKYRLNRYAIIAIEGKINESAFSISQNGIEVLIDPNGVLAQNGKTVYLQACATQESSAKLSIIDNEVEIDNIVMDKYHQAIEFYANLLTIKHMSGHKLFSPSNYASIEPLDNDAVEYFQQATIIKRNHLSARTRIWPAVDYSKHFNAIQDRIDGVSLMAEAICHNHPTGKLHEYFRVFERAFAISSTKLCKSSLVNFLSPTIFQYSSQEIQTWLEMRDTSVHADKRNQFAIEADTRKVIDRVELAAYDVLFNKVLWRNTCTKRRSVFFPAYGPLDNDDKALIVQGSAPKMSLLPLDGFLAYSMFLGKGFDEKLPDGWIGTKITPERVSSREIRVIANPECSNAT